MWLTSFLNKPRPGEGNPPCRARRAKPTAPRLQLEPLEDRTVPSFLPPVPYAVGTVPLAVTTGDFNGDGKPDLAAVNEAAYTASILLGNGDGTFGTARDI